MGLKWSGLLLCWLGIACAHAQLGEQEWEASAMLPAPVRFDGEKLAANLTARLAEHEKLTGVDAQENLWVIRFAKGAAQVSVSPTPGPTKEALEACRRATWYWRQACEALQPQRATAHISMRGTELRKLESAVLMTKVVASVVELGGASAVLWGTSLQSSEAFLKGSAAVSVRNIPAMLWVDYQLRREASGKVSIFTRGLKAFNLMELEAKDAPVAGHELLELMLDTTQNLIARGPVLQDGESIGRSPTRRIYVKFADSFSHPGRKAYRIQFDG